MYFLARETRKKNTDFFFALCTTRRNSQSNDHTGDHIRLNRIFKNKKKMIMKGR